MQLWKTDGIEIGKVTGSESRISAQAFSPDGQSRAEEGCPRSRADCTALANSTMTLSPAVPNIWPPCSRDA